MRCYYIGQFEANVDDEPFITWACFHPESKTTIEVPVDCPVEFGNSCLFEGGPFDSETEEGK